jgi:hypothetical protein
LGLAANSTNQQVWTALNDEVWNTIKQTTMNVEMQQQQAAIVVSDIT